MLFIICLFIYVCCMAISPSDTQEMRVKNVFISVIIGILTLSLFVVLVVLGETIISIDKKLQKLHHDSI